MSHNIFLLGKLLNLQPQHTRPPLSNGCFFMKFSLKCTSAKRKCSCFVLTLQLSPSLVCGHSINLLFREIIQCQDELRAIEAATSIDQLLRRCHTDYTTIVTAGQTQATNEAVYVIEVEPQVKMTPSSARAMFLSSKKDFSFFTCSRQKVCDFLN